MRAYEVSDGFDKVFCATLSEATRVDKEFHRRARHIGRDVITTIGVVEITEIPPEERAYVAALFLGELKPGETQDRKP